MTSYRLMFVVALLVATIGETAVLLIVSRLAKFEKKPLLKLLFAGSIPSIASLPWLWYVMPNFLAMTTFNVTLAEIFIMLCEALLIHLITGYKYGQSVILSFAMNIVSYLIGMLIF